MNIWQNRLDNKYDVFVESKNNGRNGYTGDLVIKENEKELLREQVIISFAARFGPDIGDVASWEIRCCEFIDNLNKMLKEKM